jgi:hypothetical protein
MNVMDVCLSVSQYICMSASPPLREGSHDICMIYICITLFAYLFADVFICLLLLVCVCVCDAAMKGGDKQLSQRMMRGRVAAQGFTVLAIFFGIFYKTQYSILPPALVPSSSSSSSAGEGGGSSGD